MYNDAIFNVFVERIVKEVIDKIIEKENGLWETRQLLSANNTKLIVKSKYKL